MVVVTVELVVCVADTPAGIGFTAGGVAGVGLLLLPPPQATKTIVANK